ATPWGHAGRSRTTRSSVLSKARSLSSDTVGMRWKRTVVASRLGWQSSITIAGGGPRTSACAEPLALSPVDVTELTCDWEAQPAPSRAARIRGRSGEAFDMAHLMGWYWSHRDGCDRLRGDSVHRTLEVFRATKSPVRDRGRCARAGTSRARRRSA